jgi:hypothetical protein
MLKNLTYADEIDKFGLVTDFRIYPRPVSLFSSDAGLSFYGVGDISAWTSAARRRAIAALVEPLGRPRTGFTGREDASIQDSNSDRRILKLLPIFFAGSGGRPLLFFLISRQTVGCEIAKIVATSLIVRNSGVTSK